MENEWSILGIEMNKNCPNEELVCIYFKGRLISSVGFSELKKWIQIKIMLLGQIQDAQSLEFWTEKKIKFSVESNSWGINLCNRSKNLI